MVQPRGLQEGAQALLDTLSASSCLWGFLKGDAEQLIKSTDAAEIAKVYYIQWNGVGGIITEHDNALHLTRNSLYPIDVSMFLELR